MRKQYSMERIQCQIVEYAPVLITTCNRARHLQECIDALKMCKHAKDTEVYISVDYPPSESYYEGHSLIVDYLRNNIEGFKEVFVFFHEENLGALENYEFIINTVCLKGYEYYIFLEDDINVKPAFLDFMNKCFEYFKDDDNVIGIHASGGNVISKVDGYNTIYAHYGACYGWFSKRRNFAKAQVDSNYLLDILLDNNKRRKLISISKQVFSHCVTIALGLEPKLMNKDGTVAFIDYCSTIYNLMENHYSIASLQSMVINNGLDGSGIHSGVGQDNPQFGYYEEPEIDPIVMNRDFCISEEAKVYKNEKVDVKYYLKCCICVFVLRKCGKKISQSVWRFMEWVSKKRPRFASSS